MKRTKLSTRPPLPKNLSSALNALEDCLTKKSLVTGANLVRVVRNDIVLLASDESLKLLSENSHQVFADGTFRYCPRFFHQLYTFHIFKNGFYIPCAYFLLKDKKEQTYKIMLDILKDVCENISIKTLTVDFECAMMSAIRKCLPTTTIRGCRFHLAQAWLRKIKALGFQKIFVDRDGPIASWLKMLFGFPALDSNIIGNFFCNTFAKCASPELNNFVNYLNCEYMTPTSRFPPTLWADIATLDIQTTTNGCEAFHRHFGDTFESPRPNIYVFLSKLNNIQSLFEIKSRSSICRREQKIKFIKYMYKKLKNGSISEIPFLKIVSSGFQPISRKSNRRRSVVMKIINKYANK